MSQKVGPASDTSALPRWQLGGNGEGLEVLPPHAAVESDASSAPARARRNWWGLMQ